MLRDLKTLALRFNWRLFAGFLLLGVLSGAFFGSLGASAAPVAKSNLETAAGRQQNYLFVLVDDARAEEARLLAIWLAAGYPASSEINWVPLYPQAIGLGEQRYTLAHDPLKIDPVNLDALEGLRLLREQGLWWDEVFLMDTQALRRIETLLPLDQGLDMASNTWEEPQTALHEQVVFLQAACRAAPALSAEGALDEVLGLMLEPRHLRSSLNTFDFIALWDLFASQGFALNCQHPWAD